MDTTTIETFIRTTAADMLIKIMAAIAFWIIGRWLIGRMIKVVRAAVHRNHIDATLTRYQTLRSARPGAACSTSTWSGR